MDMPDGLPNTLWGWDIADLAEAIVDGPKRELPDGGSAVKINGNWYRANVDRPEVFLEIVDVE